MEDFADANVMFGLMSSREGISRVERLLNEFEAHEAKEDRALEFYKQTLAHMPNPMSRFLMQLIVSDEEKHRAVVGAMAATLRGSLTWTRPPDSLEGAGERPTADAKLRETTEELLRLEKEGIGEYRELIRESSGYYNGLFKILLDSMIRGSEKHMELLEFLNEHLKRI
jgi:bacterioferritin (cytochrome b1)